MGTLVAAAKEKGDDYRADYLSIMQHELQASAAMVRGETDAALKHLEKAVALEAKQGPPSGPAGPIKPSYELYGEFLVKAGKYEEAVAVLRTSLQRTPNRTHSLLALARASVKLGDVETANEAYATLKRFLKDADANVPFLNESEVTKLRPTRAATKPFGAKSRRRRRPPFVASCSNQAGPGSRRRATVSSW